MDTIEHLKNNLLSIDQSSRENGWAIFIDGTLKDYGLIHLSDDDLGKRLVQLRQDLINLINQYNINYIAFEDIQMQTSVGNNVKTFKVLANVYGVILELCEELKINYIIVSSNTWKSSLSIKGKNRPAQKKDAQRYVWETYKLKVAQDTVDAICIGSHVCGAGLSRSASAATANKNEGFDWSE